MTQGLITENIKYVNGALGPVADALAGTVYSDVVSLSKYKKAAIFLKRGVGTTGTQTLTVQACDDFTPSNTEDIAFTYRRLSSGDTLGDKTAATSAGFTTAAGGADTYILEIDADALPEGKPNFRLKSVEVVDAAVVADVFIMLSDPRYGGDDLPTAIA